MQENRGPQGSPTGSRQGELDVRGMAEPEKHSALVAAYEELAVDEALLLADDRDPRPLRQALERDYGPGFDWEPLGRDAGEGQIRITKRAGTALPRVVADSSVLAEQGASGATGAVFSLRMRRRDLDSNVVALGPSGQIDEHAGPEVDVLIHVISGAGQLRTEVGAVDLTPGAVLWLPKRSHRAFQAGPEGLTYLTVHQRRQSLVLHTSPPAGAR